MTTKLTYAPRALGFWVFSYGAASAAGIFYFATHGMAEDTSKYPSLWLGHDALQVACVCAAPIGFAVALAYLRLLIGKDKEAASYDSEGVTVRGLWKTKYFSARSLTDVRIDTVTDRYGVSKYVTIEGDGRQARISVAVIAGGLDAAEIWISRLKHSTFSL